LMILLQILKVLLGGYSNKREHRPARWQAGTLRHRDIL